MEIQYASENLNRRIQLTLINLLGMPRMSYGFRLKLLSCSTYVRPNTNKETPGANKVYLHVISILQIRRFTFKDVSCISPGRLED